MMKKRGLSLWMALCLMLSLASPALAAESAAAIRLAKTTGTVTVTKSSEKPLTLLKNMRLYNGYHVVTGAGSYAWLDLDDTKLVKMDASSEVEVRKSGKKLEVNMSSGGVFFDVAEKLKDDESLNISTSTMIVGIRGTAGYVTVEDRWTTHVTILEGSAQCSVTDPVTGQVETAIIHGGETAACVVYRPEQVEDRCDILLERQEVPSIPGFVLTDLVRDMDLCDRIEADTGMDIPAELAKIAGGDPSGRVPDRTGATQEVLGEADRRETGEAAERQEAQEEAEELQAAENDGASPDKVLDPKAPQPGAGGSGGSSGSSGGGGAAPPAASVTRTMKLTDLEVQSLLGSYNTVTLQPDPAPDGTVDYPNTLEVDTGLSVAAGKALTLETGVDLLVYPGKTLQIDGTVTADALTNNGVTTVSSGNTLRLRGGLQGGGTLAVPATGRVVVDGVFSPSGALTLTNGATVLARTFGPDIRLPQDWTVSQAADSSGYYQLVYSGGVVDPDPDPGPGSTIQVTLNDNFSSVRSSLTDTVTQTEIDTASPTAALPAGPAAPAANSGASASYAFAGWYDAAAGGTQITDVTALNTGAALYAHWTSSGGWDWELNADTGALRIFGTGPMTIPAGGAPWSGGAASITEVRIGEGMTSVGNDAFQGCTGLTSVVIPGSVTAIDANAFDNSGLTDIYFGGTRSRWDAFAYKAPGTVTVHCASFLVTLHGNGGTWNGADTLELETGTDGRLAAMPAMPTRADGDSTYAIDAWHDAETGGNQVILGTDTVFKQDTDLYAQWTVAFGWTYDPDTATLRIFGKGPMPDYTSTSTNPPPWSAHKSEAANLVIEDGITSIGNNAFSGFSKLTAATITDDVTRIGNSAFSSCGALDFQLPAQLTTIEGYAFLSCSNLRLTALPDGLTSIGAYAFHYCRSLNLTSLPAGTTSIGASAFRECSGMTAIDIPAGVTEIPEYAFYNCTSLASVTIPDGVTSIGEHAFFGCAPLTKLTIPGSVKTVGTRAFEQCTNLSDLTISDGVESLGSYAFMSCTGLENVTIPDSVTTMESAVFNGCGKLKTVRLSEKLETIPTMAFMNCTSLTSITIPASVTLIDRSAFSGCTGLVELNLSSGLVTIDNYAFNNCTSLTGGADGTLRLPDTVTTIGSNAFQNAGVTEIYLPSGMTSIDAAAFGGTSLTDIYYDGTRSEWDAKNFAYQPDENVITLHCTDTP